MLAVAVGVVASGAMPAFGGDRAASRTLSYEVVSIKLNKSPSAAASMQARPNGEVYTNITVGSLILSAYGRTTTGDVIGWPKWSDKARFDVNAKMDADTSAKLQMLPINEQVVRRQLMLRSLLAERFRLRVHDGKKRRRVYALVVAKQGCKLKKSDVGQAQTGKSDIPLGTMSVGFGQLTGRGISTSMLVAQLSGLIGDIVVNQTDLAGTYDVSLKWTPLKTVAPDTSAAPETPLATAIEDQLGLRLVTAKRSMPVIVIDHIEMPTEN
jgi:uncharacterized protein (TIGR03435 family)